MPYVLRARLIQRALLPGRPFVERTSTLINFLRRALWPAEVLFLRIWKRVAPYAKLRPPKSRPPGSRYVEKLPQPGTIRPLEKFEFDLLCREQKYYRGRWPYMSTARDAARDLIDRYNLRTALELGPHLRSLIVGADVIELRNRDDIELEGRLIVHDATVAPWPVSDKAYDLFVGLQVFEHLDDRQRAAFAEVRRVAKHAIISVPIDWVMRNPTDCHHQISREKVLSWFAPIAPTHVLVGSLEPRTRLVYVFENLPAPEPTVPGIQR
jgi:hypothetical protein